MRDDGFSQVNRRDFLQTGAAAVATTATLASLTPGANAQEPPATPKVLPRRTLGKTGVDVTILNQGTWQPQNLDRMLRVGYAAGIRYIDTAKSYKSEPEVAKWFESMPKGTREQVFLVTKDHPKTPKDLIAQLDERCAALKVDYIDMLYIHGIGEGSGYGAQCLDWPKSKEFKDTIAAIKKTGKCKFVGFSCHDAKKAQLLQSAAEGGFVDAIMVAYTPWLDKDAPLNRALDACHKAGIGLISMKQISGVNDVILKKVPEHVPSLKEKGLSAYQGLLHAIWTDERIASCCVSMRNTDQLRENTKAAEVFEPLKAVEMKQLREVLLASNPTFCANCDGSCSRAAGTEADLGDLARLLTYHNHYGFRGEARKLYSELPEKAKDWTGADLAAASEACHNRLDFAKLLAKVERDLA